MLLLDDQRILEWNYMHTLADHATWFRLLLLDFYVRWLHKADSREVRIYIRLGFIWFHFFYQTVIKLIEAGWEFWLAYFMFLHHAKGFVKFKKLFIFFASIELLFDATIRIDKLSATAFSHNLGHQYLYPFRYEWEINLLLCWLLETLEWLLYLYRDH